MKPYFTQQQAENLLRKQKNYFKIGQTRDYLFRMRQLIKLYASILKYESRINEALYQDLGKCPAESYSSEVGFILNSLSHTMRHLKKWMRLKKKKSPPYLFYSKSRVLKEPYGSVCIIGPFNYPFQLVMEPLIGALAAGNCAVLSPSELAPCVSRVIKQLIRETFPSEYVSCVDGGIRNNSILLHAGFDYLFFTGSISVGKIVMEAASRTLTPVTLELGGKSPVIIDKDARLKSACRRILWGKLMNAGQTCVAPDYVFVAKDRMEEFLEELKNTLSRFYGTDCFSNPDYGRIVNSRHMERLCTILEKDKDALVFGGRYNKEQRYIEPAILCPKSLNAACMQEEVFGPLLPVFPYSDLKEVIHYINSHPKPLALYVFSENRTVIREILQQTSSGGVSVNDTISHMIHPDLPFGGVGASGMGAYHGEYSFQTFSHMKSVLIRSSFLGIPITYPPYTERKLALVRRFFH